MSGSASGTATPTGQLMSLLAWVYLDHHRPGKAVILLEALLALGAADAALRILLALACQRAGQNDKALATLQDLPALHDAGLASAAELIRAQALQALGRDDEAAAAMRAYVAQCAVARADNGVTQG